MTWEYGEEPSKERVAPGYRYVLTLKERTPEDDLDDTSKKAVQNFVDSALGLMTAGCEVCAYSRRMYCEKLHKPVNVGDVRCESFARRPSAVLTR